jgi:hypothetical protein
VDTPQDIYFFHFAVNFGQTRDEFKWASFKTDKDFLTFHGAFVESDNNNNWAFVREEL